MDNQQDQSGPMPGDDIRVQNAGTNTGSTGLGNDATASGAASRKGARGSAQATPDAQSGNQTDQPSAEAGQQAGQSEQSQPEGQLGNQLLDSAINSGKKWIEDSGLLNGVNQLPENAKQWGSRALSSVKDLSTTQKVIGGTLLAAGIGWLALRKSKSSDSSSESSPYNYGRQRDAGSYGRRSYGYQAPDASTSRRPVAGSGRSDSGAPYGNGGSRYGSSASYGGGSTGINSGSGRNAGSASSTGGASANTDHGARTSESSHRSSDDNFRSIE
jgi:hypothetical protein